MNQNRSTLSLHTTGAEHYSCGSGLECGCLLSNPSLWQGNCGGQESKVFYSLNCLITQVLLMCCVWQGKPIPGVLHFCTTVSLPHSVTFTRLHALPTIEETEVPTIPCTCQPVATASNTLCGSFLQFVAFHRFLGALQTTSNHDVIFYHIKRDLAMQSITLESRQFHTITTFLGPHFWPLLILLSLAASKHCSGFVLNWSL